MAERTITLRCERCDQSFDRVIQRGKTPKRCPDCKLIGDPYGPCSEDDCETPASRKTPRPLCAKHHWRFQKFGTTNLVTRVGTCTDCGEKVQAESVGRKLRERCGACAKIKRAADRKADAEGKPRTCGDCAAEYVRSKDRPGATKRCPDCLDKRAVTRSRPLPVCKSCDQTFGDETTNRHTAYCSPTCRAAGKEANIKAMRDGCGPCDVDDCDKPKRTPGAKLCEQHYIRQWRHGDETIVHGRRANGKCFHCDEPVGRKLKFCSIVCRRRYAIRAPGREHNCAVCTTPLPELAIYGTLYCTNACERTAQRAKKYGVAPSEMHAFASAKSCQMCGRAEVELVVDHCHDSGRLRGMLCSQCNVGIGMFADSQDRLRKAIAYLKRDADRNANGEQLMLVG